MTGGEQCDPCSKEAFDFSAEVENFTQKQRGMGAIVTFLALCEIRQMVT